MQPVKNRNDARVRANDHAPGSADDFQIATHLQWYFRARNGDEYDITLRLPMRERPTIEALDEIEVAAANGRQIPLRR